MQKRNLETMNILPLEKIDPSTGFYHKEILVPIRTGDLPIKQKRIRKRVILSRFDKNNSVFKEWEVDTDSMLKKSFEADMAYSKIKKFTVDQNTYNEVTEVLFKHIRKIKDIFTYGIGTSSFPSISWMDFSGMCQSWRINDKNLSIATIDRVFIATNVELTDQADNPDRDLCRYEFYEILARLGKEKYHTTKICPTIASAVEKLLEEIFYY